MTKPRRNDVSKNYNIDGDMLMIRKDSNIQLDEIEKEIGSTITIVDTLTPGTCTLQGDKVACRRFRITTRKLTAGEVAAAEAAEKKRLADEAAAKAKADAETKAKAEAALKSAPPPPPK